MLICRAERNGLFVNDATIEDTMLVLISSLPNFFALRIYREKKTRYIFQSRPDNTAYMIYMSMYFGSFHSDASTKSYNISYTATSIKPAFDIGSRSVYLLPLFRSEIDPKKLRPID